MSNITISPTKVTREIGNLLHNNMKFVSTIERYYDPTTPGGQRDGGSIQLRIPPKYTTSTGPNLDVQDTTEQQVTLTRGTQRHVDINFTTEELTQDLDDFSSNVLAPAVNVLASVIDYDAMSMALEVYNSVGTYGTTPATALVWLQANAKLSQFGVPTDMRNAALDPTANASTVDGLKGLFNPTTNVARQYVKGMMEAPALGFEGWYMTQNVRKHTTGSGAATSWQVDEPSGTNLVEGTRILDMDGGSASETMTVGDVFTIGSVYAVNPETKQSTGELMQFVVTNAATASSGQITGGTGTGQLQFSPAIYSSASGGLQNVDALPADGAAVTVIGSASTAYPQNLAYHRDAFVLATADLIMPKGVDFAAREVLDGISIRLVRQYRIGNDDIPCRADVLYGYKTRRPEMACRVWG